MSHSIGKITIPWTPDLSAALKECYRRHAVKTRSLHAEG